MSAPVPELSTATDRIGATYARLRAAGRAGFVPFIMAGDPDLETTL